MRDYISGSATATGTDSNKNKFLLFPQRDLPYLAKIFSQVFPADCKLFQDLFIHSLVYPRREEAGQSSTWLNMYQELMKKQLDSGLQQARMNLLP